MRKIRTAIIFLLIFLMLIFSACSGGSDSERYTLSDTVISSPADGASSKPETRFGKSDRIAVSGLTELYFCEKTYSVAVKDGTTNAWWRSLPSVTDKKAEYTPCVLSLEVMYKGQRYYLDSQRDAVARGSVTSEKTEDGIIVVYGFTLELQDGKTAVYTVPVEYALADGSLFVRVNCSNLYGEDCPSDAVITKLNLLNFFGAGTRSASGDYILVPDNCGGVIYTDKAKADFGDVSLRVYGDTESSNAFLGAYGMKRGDNAFVALVEQGEGIAEIKARVAASEAKYNMVGASFSLTETELQAGRNDKTYVYVPSLGYTGEIGICYRFLSGSNADYSGMAIACREQLIRNGILSSDTAQASEDLPFVASVIGVAKTRENGKNTALTTYEQLQDMLTLLKAKGIDNIYVKYRGALSGGLDQSGVGESLAPNKLLGGEKELEELKEYVTAQKIKLFFDVNYLTSPHGTLRKQQLATDITGKTAIDENKNIFGVAENRNMVTASQIEENIINLHSFLRENSITHVSLSDCSSMLYADYSAYATREEVKNKIASENLSLSSTAELMVTKGNFYTLKNASVISSLPTGTSVKESSAYAGVPFIQLILHGTLDYSCEPVNYAEDYRREILKAVEYGALGEFEWFYEDISAEEAAENAESSEEGRADNGNPDKFAYSDWANEISAYYIKGNKALGDLRGSRMTDHYKVKKGIYCTEYGDTSIYVNYTDKDYEVQGITVPANDFMRIN